MAPKWWIDLSSSIRTVVSVPLDHCRLRMLFQQVLSISLTESPPLTSALFNPLLFSLLLLFYFPATFHLYHSAMLKENCNGTMTLNFFFFTLTFSHEYMCLEWVAVVVVTQNMITHYLCLRKNWWGT